AAGDVRCGVRDEVTNHPRRPRRRRDHDAWVGSQPQPEHELIPRLGGRPGRQLVGPREIMLRTAQLPGFVRAVRGGYRAVRPRQPPLAWFVLRLEPRRAHGEDAAFAFD